MKQLSQNTLLLGLNKLLRTSRKTTSSGLAARFNKRCNNGTKRISNQSIGLYGLLTGSY